MTEVQSSPANSVEAASDRGRTDPYDILVAGLEADNRGDNTRADALIMQAYRAASGDPAIITGLAMYRRRQGHLSEAVRLCDAAIAVAPDYADAWLERGAILAAGGSSRAALLSFHEAARLAPQSANAHGGIASQAARDGDLQTAEAAAKEALAIDPDHLVAAAALGSVYIERADAESARGVLESRVAKAPPGQNRSIAASTLGRALERLGEYDRAYAAFLLANDDFAAVNARQAAGRGSHTAFVQAISGALAALPESSAFGAVDDLTPERAAPHVFLIGYPRSGTTLLENVLASLPGVAAIEEWPSFQAADRNYLGGETGMIGDGLTRLMKAPKEEIRQLQTAYWRQVAAGGRKPCSPVLVDMDPLKATRLPFIARLFPKARVLIMRRDPRDIVLSCFRTSFAMTSGTLEYVTLERAARHYDAMMRLTDVALDRLAVNALDVFYERLVNDFDQQTHAICDFAGLTWTADLRQFERTARTRGVSTASAGQVRQGLYDGSGQWRSYSKWLEPVMPILTPWIERFGYPPH